MSLHSSSHSTHHEVVASQADLDFKELRDMARRKYIPAIQRAKVDDDRQAVFTSSAANLATGGLILAELALRVAENVEKRDK